MHVAVTEILDAQAHLNDDALKVRDLFFSHDTWLPGFLALEVGGWGYHDLALAGFSMVTGVDPETGEITFDLDRAALDDAPRLEAGVDPALYHALPPLIVGPFGNTMAPLMIWTMAQEEPAPSADRGHDLRADRIEEKFDRFTAWRGREVFGSSGPLGRLEDFLVDTDSRRITHMVIERDAGQSSAVVGIHAFRHVAEGESGHLVMDMSAEELEGSIAPDTWKPRAKKGLLSALRSF